MTPAERIRSQATDPTITKVQAEATDEFRRAAHEMSVHWWVVERHPWIVGAGTHWVSTYLNWPTPNTVTATTGEIQAAHWATRMTRAHTSVALRTGVVGLEMASLIRYCTAEFALRASEMLRPGLSSEESSKRVSHLTDQAIAADGAFIEKPPQGAVPQD
jgi:hypothetical protein